MPYSFASLHSGARDDDMLNKLRMILKEDLVKIFNHMLPRAPEFMMKTPAIIFSVPQTPHSNIGLLVSDDLAMRN